MEEDLKVRDEELATCKAVSREEESSAALVHGLATELQEQWTKTVQELEQSHKRARGGFTETLEDTRLQNELSLREVLEHHEDLARSEARAIGQLAEARRSHADLAESLEQAAVAEILKRHDVENTMVSETNELNKQLGTLRAEYFSKQKTLTDSEWRLKNELTEAALELHESRSCSHAEEEVGRVLARKASLLQRQLAAAEETCSSSEKRCAELEAERNQMRLGRDNAKHEQVDLAFAYKRTLHSRSEAIDEASRKYDLALEECGEALLERDEALRQRNVDLSDARNEVRSLQTSLVKAESQLHVDRSEIMRLEELVSVCAQSGAARAAAVYWQVSAVPGVRTELPGRGMTLYPSYFDASSSHSATISHGRHFH